MKKQLGTGIANLSKILFLFAALMVIAQCNTSNKVASGFGKRKYTPGRYTDQTARINGSYTPAGPGSEVQAAGARTDAKPVSPSGSNASPIPAAHPLTAPVPPLVIAAERKLGVNILSGNTKTDNGNAAISLKESASHKLQIPHDPRGDYSRDSDNSARKQASYLTAWLVCLGITIICWLVLLGELNSTANSPTYSNGYGTGCVLGLIGTFAFIAAVVFFILWIIAIASA